MEFLSSFAQDLMKEGEMKEEKKTEIPMMKFVTDDFEMEDEAEEIAALNLAKYRKSHQELEETEDRNKMADAQLAVRQF